jgi:hypothetical protein
VAGHETAVPAQHGLGLDNQQHFAEAGPVEHARQQGQDRAVGVGEPRQCDLALQYQDLVAQGQDLRVTVIA